MSGSTQARIALNRFGLGARPGDVAVVSSDPVGWLLRQTTLAAAEPIPGVLTAQQQLLTFDYHMNGGDLVSRMALGVSTLNPFTERLARFWSNHLAVNAGKVLATCTAVPYENEAIRPFVNGRFVDMLKASQRHQAMLIYLDLSGQMGPKSPDGIKARSRSYDENYAREVMELHTIGVDAGFTPTDVKELALALTGWRVWKVTGLATYQSSSHEPGIRTVLGTALPAGDGQADAAMTLLANHPATRTRICTKLAAHFLGDSPPAELVDAMAAAWGDGGNLPAIYRAMVTHPAAWQPAAQTFKTPERFIISAARALGIAPPTRSGPDQCLMHHLNALGQAPFMPPTPQGYPDDEASWLVPSQILMRVNAAASLVKHATTRIKPADLLAEILAPDPASHTTDTVCNAASKAEAFALLLASPEFQRS